VKEEKLRYKAMKAALDDPELSPEGAELGFFANHFYPLEKFGEGPPHLEGRDLHRFAVLKHLGLDVELTSLIDLERNGMKRRYLEQLK
jgi:hypothetical protein